LHREFRVVDDDEDGVLNIDELEKLMKVISPNVDLEKLI
jgi:Ca2+-binding EF-hand superfamily protein